MAALIQILLLFLFAPDNRPVETATDVIKIVSEQSNLLLWPDFRPTEIPVPVSDSVDTWLFYSNEPPEGFTAVEQYPGVYLFKGQHPLVRGNSVVRLGNWWTATSVFSRHARMTGERYTERDLAVLMIHEQFHVFQREKHLRWRQDDGVLLRSPAETTDALFLRRSEKEAFRRVVLSANTEEMTVWVREDLKSMNP
jgi:hypothetical protein